MVSYSGERTSLNMMLKQEKRQDTNIEDGECRQQVAKSVPLSRVFSFLFGSVVLNLFSNLQWLLFVPLVLILKTLLCVYGM
jgi:hypothetical protein